MEYVNTRGITVPALGLGTYRMTGETCENAVEVALKLGYRHFDTAQLYNNERAVGAAIEASAIPRDEIFVVTKIDRSNLEYEKLVNSAKTSYDALGGEQIDLLLLHAPSRTVPIEESIRGLNDLQEENIVRHIGVSNYSIKQLKTAREASQSPIITNQVEYHPFIDQRELLEYCTINDVMLTAYTPFARGRVYQNKTLSTIGDRYNKSPAQVTLRWLTQQPRVSTIPKSSQKSHLQENINIFDFELTAEELESINELS